MLDIDSVPQDSVVWLKAHSPNRPAHDVVHVQPLLPPCIQQPVISIVVVTLPPASTARNKLC